MSHRDANPRLTPLSGAPHPSSPSTSAYSSPRPRQVDGDHLSNLKVAVRIRPFSSLESSRGDEAMFSILPDRQTLQIISGQGVNRTNASAASLKSFTFHSALSPDCRQDQVMNLLGVHQLLDAALLGYHVSILAYGQTGSGKTYTMSGREDVISEPDYNGNHEEDGLTTRSIRYVFSQIAKHRAHQHHESFVVRASYCEVYNELCYDLLADHTHVTPQANHQGPKSLAVRWDVQKGFYVPELKVIECRSIEAVLRAISQGMKNRRVASHELNRESSRSHTIFTLYVEARSNGESTDNEPLTRLGKVSFVDLAGSERLKLTKSSGDAMIKETSNINRSLFTLGKVISALSARSNGGGGTGGATPAPIPYRESLLTKLLMDSLGGSALTLMVACCSPSSAYFDETFSTLQYAVKAKAIQNRPEIQIEQHDASLAQLRRELQLLRSENVFLRQQMTTIKAQAAAGAPPASAPHPAAPSNLSRPPLPLPFSSSSTHRIDSAGHTPTSSAPGTPSRLGYQAATTLENSLVALEAPSSRPQLKALSAQVLKTGFITPDAELERLQKPELVRRLKEAQALLDRFFSENDHLAKDLERLRAQRQILALDHRSVMDENDRLHSKVILLEKMLRDVGVLPPVTPHSRAGSNYGSGLDSRGGYGGGYDSRRGGYSGASTPGREGSSGHSVLASLATSQMQQGGPPYGPRQTTVAAMYSNQPSRSNSMTPARGGGGAAAGLSPLAPDPNRSSPALYSGPSTEMHRAASDQHLRPDLQGLSARGTLPSSIRPQQESPSAPPPGDSSLDPDPPVAARRSSYKELHVEIQDANGATPKAPVPTNGSARSSMGALSLTPVDLSPAPSNPNLGPIVDRMPEPLSKASSYTARSRPPSSDLALSRAPSKKGSALVPGSGAPKPPSVGHAHRHHHGNASASSGTSDAVVGNGLSAASSKKEGGQIQVAADKLSLLLG